MASLANPHTYRYVKIFQAVDLNTDFFFSYTYDLTNTLQFNCVMYTKAQHDLERRMASQRAQRREDEIRAKSLWLKVHEKRMSTVPQSRGGEVKGTGEQEWAAQGDAAGVFTVKVELSVWGYAWSCSRSGV